MEAAVLGWDLERGARWMPSYERALAARRAAGTVTTPWSIGTAAAPPAGTRVHLMLQGRTRGLVGRGTVRSAPYLAADPERPGALSTHVLVEWDLLARVADRIEPDALVRRVPGIAWRELYGSVHVLTEEEARALDRALLAPHRATLLGAAALVDMVGDLVGHVARLAHLAPGRIVSGLLRPLATAGHAAPDEPAA